MKKNKLIAALTVDGIGHWITAKAASHIFEWPKWCKEIPCISFPAHWKVQIVPPFAAAIVRFRVQHLHRFDETISVYLDCYNHLGLYGLDEKGNPVPYWEIYPAADGDTARFDMNDIGGLLKAIEEAIQ